MWVQENRAVKKKYVVVKVRERWNVLKRVLLQWKMKADSKVKNRIKNQKATTYFKTLARKKSLKSWKIFVSEKIKKNSKYATYLKIYYESLLRKTMVEWDSTIKRHVRNKGNAGRIIKNSKNFKRRQYMNLWIRAYNFTLDVFLDN